MTDDWKADKSLNWLDTWREIENVYRKHPEKVKAIGAASQLAIILAQLQWLARRQVSPTSRRLTSGTYSSSPT